ncbi:MAG TPA: DUF6531 domain-containing protein [Fibrobacteria bacterium]|nr:DUF6531 domain-containing protein [Fibrobacteria bacterium]
MMQNSPPKPFLIDRFRRAKWLAAVVLPFFIYTAVDAGVVTRAIAGEKAERSYRQGVEARKSEAGSRLDPEAYLEQTLKEDPAGNGSGPGPGKESPRPKAPDNAALKRRFQEQVRKARFRHFDELREQVRRMQVQSLSGETDEEEWKTLELKLANIAQVVPGIQRESEAEIASLSDRGVGFWKRFRYSRQQRKMIKAFLKLGRDRGEIIGKRDLKRMVKALELDRKPAAADYKPQFRSIQSDLQVPGAGKAKPDGLRRQARAEVPAQIEWVRLADGGGGGVLPPPTPAPTYGEAIDASVSAFAQEQGYDAARIFKAIYDKFEFEPYYGIVKGAKGTLLDGKGNDWDLAMLLRDALRASGYESELEHGLVENEFPELAQFLGVDNPDKVSYLLATAGIPGSIIQDGPRRFARFEHVWVAAKVPYEDYRGRAGSSGERQWIDLDPGFKSHATRPGIRVDGGLAFSFDDYVSRLDVRSPQEYFEDSLWAFMKRANIICNALGEIPLHSEIVPLEGPYLPNGLRSTLVSTIGSYRSAPEAYRKKVVLTLQDKDGDALLSRILTLEEALYGSVTLTYGPAADNDARLIESYDGLENVPPYLLRLLPELRIDGEIVQVGDEIGAGQKLQVRLDISGQHLNVETEKFPAVAGAETALLLAQGGISAGAFTHHIAVLSRLQNDSAVPERALTAQRRYLLGAKYYYDFGVSAERLAGYFNYRYVGGVHAGFSATKMVVGGLFGLANSWTREGTVFSAERFYLGIVPLGTATVASTVFNRLIGAQSSFLEHQSGESVNSKDFISTVKVLQLAAAAGIAKDTLTAANIDAKIASFAFLDADAVADICNALGLGKIAILPKAQVTRNQWTGTGYVLLNAASGSGDYIISGRYAGGDETGGDENNDEKPGCACSGADSRIYHANGQYVSDHTELVVPSKGIPAVFTFGYNSQRQYASEMGYGWQHAFGRRLFAEGGGAKVTFYDDDQLAQVFHDSSGTYLRPAAFSASLRASGSLYEMRRKDNTTWTFALSGQVLSIVNKDGLGLFVDTTAAGKADKVKNAAGATLLTFHYASGELTSVKDSLGRTVAFDVNGAGDLAGFTDAAGASTDFTYFEDHNLASKTDGLGNARFYLYDQKDRLMEHTDPQGGVTSYIHDYGHRLFVEVDPGGREATSFYDPHGFPTLKVDGNGNREITRYDARGNLVFKQDSRGFAYEAAYDASGNKVSEILPDSTRKLYAYDSLNLVTLDSNATEGTSIRYGYTDKGHLQQQDNADGTHETFLYDGQGQLTRKVGRAADTLIYAYNATGGVNLLVNPVGDTTRYLYDSLGRLAGFVNGVRDTTRLILDKKDRLVSLIDAAGNATKNLYDAAGRHLGYVDASGDTTKVFRDGNGNPVEIRYPDGSVAGQEFNALGQLISRTDPLGRKTRFEYEGQTGGGRLKKVVDPLGQAMQQGFCGEELEPCDIRDKTGHLFHLEREASYRLKSVTDPLGHTTRFAYNSRGQKTSAIQSNGRMTLYGYDSEGRLTHVLTLPGDTTLYVYNALGQKIYSIAPGRDTTSYAYDKAGNLLQEKNLLGAYTRYTYDAAGRRSTAVDPNGDTTRFLYGKTGRIVRIAYQDGAVDTFAYDADGRKTLASNGKVSYQYKYDKRGRLAEFLDQGLAKSIRYEYDAAGNLTARINGENELTTYKYDGLDRLIEIKDVLGGLTGFEYDGMGRRIRASYPNGTRTETRYDASGRVAELTHFNGAGTVLDRFQYAYDGIGNLLSERTPQGVYTYAYDRLDRLKSILYPDGSSRIIAYNASGRKALEVETHGGLPDTAVYHYTRDRLDSISGAHRRAFAFDANGNLTRASDVAGSTHYQYTSKGDLVRIHAPDGTTRAFTPDVNRVPVADTRLGSQLDLFLDPQSQSQTAGLTATYRLGTKVIDYGMGPREGEILWEKDSTGVRYFHYDAKGTLVAITNASGALTGDLGFTDQVTAKDSAYGQSLAANPDPAAFVTGAFALPSDPVANDFPALPLIGQLYPNSRDWNSPVNGSFPNPQFISTSLPAWIQSQLPSLAPGRLATLQAATPPVFHRIFARNPIASCLPGPSAQAALDNLQATLNETDSPFRNPYAFQRIPYLPAKPRALTGSGPVVRIFLTKNPATPGQSITATVQATSDTTITSVQLYVDDSLVTLTSLACTFSRATEGVHTLTAIAQDAKGRRTVARGGLLVSVSADNTPPTLSISHSPSSPAVGDSVTFTVTASDNTALDPERVWLQVDGRYVAFTTPFVTKVLATLKGKLPAFATAYDMSRNFASVVDTVLVTGTGDESTLPQAILTSPAADSVLYLRTLVKGTATDAHFAYYSLAYLWKGSDDTVEFFRSTRSVSNDTLGFLDATVRENGDYELILSVVDAFHNVKRTSVPVRISGEAKIGTFSLSFKDLSIQLPGLNLEVLRTYSSQDKQEGDFGFGWKLDMKSVTLTENNVAGEGWTISRSGGPFTSWKILPTKPHTVSVRLPGQRDQVFDIVPTFDQALFSPVMGTVAYVARKGVYSKLEALDGGVFQRNADDLMQPDGMAFYDPSRYQLTLTDGTRFILDQNRDGVVEIADPNGNRITLTATGVTHSTGDELLFNRDSKGRITSIVDEQRRTVAYTYDSHGNLASSADPLGNVTQYKYAQDHFLTDILDPRGVRVSRTEYDSAGRMIRQITPAGDTVLASHDLANRQETLEDAEGGITRFSYDAQGNVLSKTDAMGFTWGYSYDSVGNQIGTLAPNGATTISTFDAQGNEIRHVDELGHVTERTFNDQGKLLSETDPLGRVTRHEYDPRGNLLKSFGPDNKLQMEYVFDGQGNLASEKDALGRQTTHVYDALGRKTMTTDALGRTRKFAYDAQGNLTEETDARGNTTTNTYDADGKLLTSEDALGNVATHYYDATGRVIQDKDKRNASTFYKFDLNGNKTVDSLPDGTVRRKTYDGRGKMSQSTDEVGRTTKFRYDAEGRLLETEFADTSIVKTEYDSLGRRKASLDARGNKTHYFLDKAGRDTLILDALGHAMRFAYDAAGRKISQTDALNHTTTYCYDLYDRLIETIYPDASSRKTTYDAAGQKVSEIDPEGKTTTFAYDAVGNLVSVKDPMGFITRYAYDANNNRLSQTDANGHTTTMAYDKLNRQSSRTYPNSDQERWGYDAEGNMLYHVNGVGDSTVHTYNALGRETHRSYAGGHQLSITYTPDGKQDSVTDHRGLTKYTYDSRGRLKKTLHPNGQFIENRYDRQGNRTHMITPFDTTRYAYDSLNRMDSVVSPQNKTTTYHYDAVGNRDSVVSPNGTTSGYQYDALNRLTRVRHYKAGTILAHYAYALSAAGIRTQVTEKDSSKAFFAYDSLYRLKSERRTGNHTDTMTYTYDLVGNRLTKVHRGVTTNYAYNNRDQLLSEWDGADSTLYAYDSAGRMLTKAEVGGTTHYRWRDEDRLDSLYGLGVSVKYQYDADGRRVKDSTGSTVRQYLIDPLLLYGQVIAETDGSNSLVAEYVVGLDRVSLRRSGAAHYYLADGQGSTRLLTDSTGTATDSTVYTAFGETLFSSGSTPNAYLYTGEQFDGSAGLYNLRARQMDPKTGRFASVDPYAGKVGKPISQHSYLYADQSPLSKFDPTGRMSAVDVLYTTPLANTIRVTQLTVGASIASSLYGLILIYQTTGNQQAMNEMKKLGYDKQAMKAWLNDARSESPIRLRHYTTERAKRAISITGVINSPTGAGNYFTPDQYTSGEEATDKLATKDEREFYIEINLYKKADLLEGPEKIPPHTYITADDIRIRKGGGIQYYTYKPIWTGGLMRASSNWIPLTE